VGYEAVNAMLLNEFLKEHHKVQKLEANAAKQQKQIEALTAVVRKVSAQLELSKSAPQTALNNRKLPSGTRSLFVELTRVSVRLKWPH